MFSVEGTRCRIHYKGWKTKFDEWIDLNSDRLRPARSIQLCDGEQQRDLTAARRTVPNSPLQLGGDPSSCKAGNLETCEADTELRSGSLEELSEAVEEAGTCSFCSLVVGRNRISCFQCGAVFHGEPSCVGVSVEVLIVSVVLVVRF